MGNASFQTNCEGTVEATPLLTGWSSFWKGMENNWMTCDKFQGKILGLTFLQLITHKSLASPSPRSPSQRATPIAWSQGWLSGPGILVRHGEVT